MSRPSLHAGGHAASSASDEAGTRSRVGLNLFWRTFFLLALLLLGSILAWLQTLRALEFDPRTLQTAQQIASLVNLSRAALQHSDAIARVSLIDLLWQTCTQKPVAQSQAGRNGGSAKSPAPQSHS